MAEFSSPILGMQVRRNVIPANSILGRPEQVFGGGPDPQTAMAIAQNRNAIQTLSVNLDAIAAQMSGVNQSLNVISMQINQSSLIEERQAREKERQERILAEQALREGKESLVERKIQNALVTPLQKIAAKAQGPLMNLGRFFQVLLVGALGTRLLSVISKLSEDGELSMGNVFNEIKKDLAIAGGILIGLSGGFALVLRGITSLAAKLGSFLLRNLLLRPINLVFDIVKATFNTLKNLIKGIRLPGAPPRTNAPPRTGGGKPGGGTPGVGRRVFGTTAAGGIDLAIRMGFGGELDNSLVEVGSGMVGGKITSGIAAKTFSPLLAAPFPGARLLYGALVLGSYGLGYYGLSTLGGNLYEQSRLDDATNFDYTLKDMGIPDIPSLFQSPNIERNLDPAQYSTPDVNVINVDGGGGASEVPDINVPGETANNLINVESTNFENPYLINSFVQYNVGST